MDPKAGRVCTSKASSSARRNSRSLPGLVVAQYRSKSGSERLFLDFEKLGDALTGEGEEAGEFRVVEGDFLGGGLELDESAGTGHDDVHVDVGARVFVVAEVEHGFAGDDADAGGGYRGDDRERLYRLELDQLAQRENQSDVGAGDGRGARSAVGLEDVAIDDDGAVAECGRIDDRAKGASNQALDFLGAAGWVTLVHFARSAGRGGAREHGVFGGDPAASAAAQKAGYGVLDGRGAQHACVADLDERRALGRHQVIGGDAHRAQLGGLPVVDSHEALERSE